MAEVSSSTVSRPPSWVFSVSSSVSWIFSGVLDLDLEESEVLVDLENLEEPLLLVLRDLVLLRELLEPLELDLLRLEDLLLFDLLFLRFFGRERRDSASDPELFSGRSSFSLAGSDTVFSSCFSGGEATFLSDFFITISKGL